MPPQRKPSYALGVIPIQPAPLAAMPAQADWREPASTLTTPSPWLLVMLLCLGQVFLWTLVFGLTYKAPEPDSAEQLAWSFSLQNGYWKHPPLPSWLMHGLVSVFGASVTLPFAAAQLCIVVALALTWRLGCEFMSARRSSIAMLLTSLVTYHNIGGDSFNHGTVLLPFQAATLLLFFRASRCGKWHYWALTGAFAALSMLVKYVAIFPLASLLLYFAADRRLHQRRHYLGLGIALVAFSAVLAPHLVWLVAADYLPLRYARSVAHPLPDLGATVWNLFDFSLTQLERLIPFLVGLWFALSAGRTDGLRPVQSAASPSGDALFLWIAGLAPIALTLAVGLLTRTELQGRWGTNLFLMSGWLALVVSKRADTPRMLDRVLRFAVGVQLLMCVAMALSKTVVADHLHRRTRANFPGAVLAREAQVTWAANTGAPLRVVISDTWLGGNLVAHNQTPLAILIDGQESKSPWITAETVTQCGALVLVDQSVDKDPSEAMRPELAAHMARAEITGTWTLPWGDDRWPTNQVPRGQVQWGIIPPKPGLACPLDPVPGHMATGHVPAAASWLPFTGK